MFIMPNYQWHVQYSMFLISTIHNIQYLWYPIFTMFNIYVLVCIEISSCLKQDSCYRVGYSKLVEKLCVIAQYCPSCPRHLSSHPQCQINFIHCTRTCVVLARTSHMKSHKKLSHSLLTLSTTTINTKSKVSLCCPSQVCSAYC